MLRDGFLADWVLLDVDPTSCTAAEFAASRVLRTEVGGRTVFVKSGYGEEVGNL
jgi:predicted amidohydrolase YtcJ